MSYFNKKLDEIKRLVSGWKDHDWKWRVDNVENVVDDPVDDLKHKLHGLKIGPWTLRLPSWLMSNSKDKTK